ncbi:MAG: gamma-glutamyltransferase, partial [Hydrogenophaga sp.]|nr:gamma-glutamyltransferase [Hydrogenophaga sp.]
MRQLSRIGSLLLSLVLAACASQTPPDKVPAPKSAASVQPEAGSGWTPKPGWTYRRMAVAAANPLAADAGLEILRAGGSAIDAAVAVQMVLALVEPQSSGIGGGAFLLHHDGRLTQAYDGRETAPAAVDERLFLDTAGKPLPFMDAVVGGRSVGVPGAVAMLAMAQREHGRLPWARLFEPAIALAGQGFAVSPRLHALLSAETALQADPVAASYFFQPDGKPLPVGHRLRNPALAKALRLIATQGPAALQTGPLAQAIVDKARRHPTRPGQLSLEDLSSYQPRTREPMCFDHPTVNRVWQVCGMPPPSSGALAIGQILGLLSRTAQGARGLSATPDADWLHAYSEASRLAFADRALYVADPDRVTAPGGDWGSLLDPGYLDRRAALIGPQRMPQAPAGQPGVVRTAWAAMPEQAEHGTSHISIV